ncbi:MAG TPA: heme-binding domain-containing protein, partial [Anaerolineales bacterium]
MKKAVLWVIIGLVVVGLLIQLVPLPGRGNNPPVTSEPLWDSPQTRALAKRACFDCHSNETVWPWYSYVAPVSWLVYNDTMQGRRRLNFSEWNTG